MTILYFHFLFASCNGEILTCAQVVNINSVMKVAGSIGEGGTSESQECDKNYFANYIQHGYYNSK